MRNWLIRDLSTFRDEARRANCIRIVLSLDDSPAMHDEQEFRRMHALLVQAASPVELFMRMGVADMSEEQLRRCIHLATERLLNPV